MKKIIADCWRFIWSARWKYAGIMDRRVRVRPYPASLPIAAITDADVVIYSTAYQAFELSRMPRRACESVYYVLHDQSRSERDVVDVELIRATYRDAEHVVALSAATARELRAMGVRVEAVIPAGVDSAVFHPKEKEKSGTLAVLGYYWPFESRKGSEILLEAFRAIRARHPEVSLSLLAPPGVWRSEFPAFGGLPEGELADLYRRHDVFVFPSVQEGFGIPPLEAMASGCGVVATRVGAVPEYATDQHSALLCDPGDASALTGCVERLIKDTNLLALLRANAVRQAQAWSWGRAGEGLERYLMARTRP